MDKIVKISNIEKLSIELKQHGEKIILAGGCFDILHIGHIEFLEKSKNLQGRLIILLESDDSIRNIKGKNRPINSQEDRATVLSRLNMVDYVIPLPFPMDDLDYKKLVLKIKPDIITITHGDPNNGKKLEQAESVKAKLIEVMKRRKDYSTTDIIKNINNQ